MIPRRPGLLSPRFLSLYAAAIGAITLHTQRHTLGDRAWFPVAVGVVASLALIPLIGFAGDVAQSPSRRTQCAIFFTSAALPVAGVPFLTRDDLLLSAALLAWSAIYFYAGLATSRQWAPFRSPPDPDLDPDACPACGHELDADAPTCPNCGPDLHPDYDPD